MDLTAKVGLAAIIIIIIVGVAFIFKSASTPKMTESQAESTVMKDLNQTYPNALIRIISITNATPGNWTFTVSIVRNATRACPALSIESITYPKIGLLPTVINNYTELNCTILNSLSNEPYFINSPYVAQIKSYDSGNVLIKSYVDKYGYSNTLVSAKNTSMTNLNKAFTNVWLITYNAVMANYTVEAVMGFNGTILYVSNVSKIP
ncbi:MAG: hypothetical protein ACP5K5_01230 [Candidatus Micrarchaeia archaeon]